MVEFRTNLGLLAEALHLKKRTSARLADKFYLEAHVECVPKVPFWLWVNKEDSLMQVRSCRNVLVREWSYSDYDLDYKPNGCIVICRTFPTARSRIQILMPTVDYRNRSELESASVNVNKPFLWYGVTGTKQTQCAQNLLGQRHRTDQ